MSETGQVTVFTGVRKPFELREYPVPTPGPGAILVKVRLANVCGSDLHIWRGEYDVSRGQKEPFTNTSAAADVVEVACGEARRAAPRG
jgi:D-arabinose 1-dehydrogenase-like Zn-dependent alcohol dehydrogenase